MSDAIPRSASPPAENDETRQKILDAAEATFAEIGFEGATVRGICERAEVKNIGAVNYYFQTKKKLYTETVKNALRCCSEGAPFPDWPAGTPPQGMLRDFIRVMMARFMKAPRVSAMQLMMREMSHPSAACREAVLEHIQPLAQRLNGILQALLPGASAERHWLTAFSIVGQCIYYRQNRAVAEILVGKEAIEQLDTERLAAHIAGFSLAALGYASPLREESP